MKGKEIIFALSILALPAPTLAGTPKMMVEAQTSTTIRQQMDGCTASGKSTSSMIHRLMGN